MRGPGVMINDLGGNAESAALFGAALGKTLASVELRDNALYLGFTDKTGVCLQDDGQSCCEHRYMSSDDDLQHFVGAVLTGGEVRPGGTTEGEYGDAHEIEFLVVKTDRGDLTMANHNEHSGYYGGFSVRASEWVPA